MRIGGIATVPDRLEAAARAINSILKHGELDALTVALNGHDRHEAERLRQAIRPGSARVTMLPQDHSLGDAAKFSGWSQHEDFFSFDDDLYYPADYFKRLNTAQHDLAGAGPYVVSLHGRKMLPPYRHYYGRGAVKYPCLKKVQGYHRVDFPGTGVMLIPKDTLILDRSEIKYPNMADVWIGRFARQQGVACYVAPHNEGDVLHLPIDMTKTIAVSMRSKHIDQVMRETMLA